MQTSLSYQVIRIVAVILFVFSVLIGIPGLAQADATISLDESNTVVTFVTVYPTPPQNQSPVLANVAKSEESAFSNNSAFQGSAILKAQDGAQIVTLSQWKEEDVSTVQTYTEIYDLNTLADQTPQTFACQVNHTEARTTSPEFQEGDVIMFSQFKMKPEKDQSELATIISQMMPGVLQMMPGLEWAAMCPSTNESTIALLARWGSREDFESLGQKAGFDAETNYWQDYANNEHGLYDVAQIIQ